MKRSAKEFRHVEVDIVIFDRTRAVITSDTIFHHFCLNFTPQSLSLLLLPAAHDVGDDDDDDDDVQCRDYWSAMATGERELLSDDADDNVEVPAETTETTTRETVRATTAALPWLIAKARHKVKKHGSKTSKQGAGGGKAKKKGASRTKIDGERETVDVDGGSTNEPADTLSDLSTAARHDPASLPSRTATNKRHSVADVQTDDSKKSNDSLRDNIHSLYVVHLCTNLYRPR